ncbi:nuclear transport factor 2 family protein [Thalassomonas viridans]|uniref:Nuclear transport factor 2 family protein n=1 Tax=Thalassomonas viridans TaxID=137584 RepID=A0AAF0CAA1_9GAMM|nr:nuclear transport factor 2 family protein [Thalassomonas viridans]WDE05654.1 nuclear transport factor 2 family protein [Thalassomonas viridans]
MSIKSLLSLLVIAGFYIVPVQACDFECTYKKHISAIEKKDIAAFESTITKGDKLTFILPDGTFFEDSATYRKLLKGWFAEGGWTFTPEVLQVEQTSEMGTVLLKVLYHEDDRDGKPYDLEHYLYLVFKKQGDGWFLIHDQNTKVKAVKGDKSKAS